MREKFLKLDQVLKAEYFQYRKGTKAFKAQICLVLVYVCGMKSHFC